MITINNVEKWVPKAYRDQLFNYDTKINVFYGGASSGKSHFVARKKIIKGLMITPRRMLICRKVQSSIERSVWRLYLNLLTQKIPQVVADINSTTKTIRLINGNEFLFSGLDDVEKIKSIEGITDIEVEEATEITQNDFEQLLLRMRGPEKQKQIDLIFNPVSKANWVYNYFFKGDPPDNCYIKQTTYKDNPYLAKEDIETIEEMAKRNPAYYKIYALGEFATLDKLVFHNVEIRLIKKEEYENEDGTKKGLFWCGLDFGYTNDPSALNWGYYIPYEKKLLVLGEYDKTGLTNDKLADVIHSLGFSKEKWIADSAEPKSIEEIKRFGVRRIKGATKGPDSVKNGIDRMQRCDIIVDELRCPKTAEEFNNYTWKKDKKTGEYINEPIDMYNHHIDAIRYGTQDVMKKNRTAEEIAEMERINANLSRFT